MKAVPIAHQSIIAVTSLAMLVLAFCTDSFAGSAQWGASPSTGDWNTPSNWTPATIPNGSSDTATFAASSTTGVSFSANTEISGIVFNPGAGAYTITTAPNSTVTISGIGIINNSGITQNFVTSVNTLSQSSQLYFTNDATAGMDTFITNQGTHGDNFLFAAATYFYNNASAGSATFVNEHSVGTMGGQGGVINFFDQATAANGVFLNKAGTNNGEAGGSVYFNNDSTADHGTFIIEGPSGLGAPAEVRFLDNSTAANGTFINNGSSGPPVNNGGATEFWFNSNPGNALLVAYGGSNGGEGGRIIISSSNNDGNPRVQLSGNGVLDIRGAASGTTIGSLEGTGIVNLGQYNLTVGRNNLTTSFSGIIQHGSNFGGGSVTKIGSGMLALSGANTYTGPTQINAGFLVLANSLVLQNSTLATGGNGIVFDSSVVGHSFIFGGLAGSTNLTLEDNANPSNAVGLTIGNNNANTTYSGNIAGRGTITKVGTGTFTLSGANTYSGSTTISAGTLFLTGSIAHDVTVAAGAELSGPGTISGPLTIAQNAIAQTIGGALTVNNVITNNGLFILSDGAHLAGVTSFINNGVLDLMTAGPFSPPNGFVNNGTIIDSSVVRAKRVQRSDNNFFIILDSFTGHTYHMQRSSSLDPPSFVTLADPSANVQGDTPYEAVLADYNATGSRAFYRVVVDP